MALKYYTKSRRISEQFLAVIVRKKKVALHDYDLYLISRQVWTMEAALRKCRRIPGDLNRSLEIGYNALIGSALQELKRVGKIQSKKIRSSQRTGYEYSLVPVKQKKKKKKKALNAPQTP